MMALYYMNEGDLVSHTRRATSLLNLPFEAMKLSNGIRLSDRRLFS
jgi:hypothetical protein